MTEENKRKGTRCAVCVMCGKCFEDDSSGTSGWSGTRCDVCVGCGKCAEAWGLIKSGDSDADSGPTNWADAFKVMDTGSAGAPPPVNGAPGVASVNQTDADTSASIKKTENPEGQDASVDAATQTGKKPSSFACLKRGADGEDPDTSTGATPGVSSACKEFGIDDMEKFIADLGIKPPGVA